jgi:hypothetical protein
VEIRVAGEVRQVTDNYITDREQQGGGRVARICDSQSL